MELQSRYLVGRFSLDTPNNNCAESSRCLLEAVEWDARLGRDVGPRRSPFGACEERQLSIETDEMFNKQRRVFLIVTPSRFLIAQL